MNTALQIQFHNIPVSIVDHNGKKWLTSEQIGICLGYSKEFARQSINKLHDRHSDEFSLSDTCEVNLTSQGQSRAMRIFSDTGCVKLGFFANTKTSKEFRQFASEVLAKGTHYVPTPITAKPDSLDVVNARLDRLEQATAIMSQNMGKLVDISFQQSAKLDVVSRYISLLEINQKGTVKVTRKIEAYTLGLKAEGWSNANIGRKLRISPATVSLILSGRYKFSAHEASLPAVTIEEIMDELVEKEQAATLKRLQGGK